ncbi:MAG: cobyrinate a,c-diamide synthase [Azospirillaceae bacterium]
MGAPRGLVIAAPASGHGKTTVTLGLLRALARSGRRVAGVKIGPDYIDPAFHAAACGRPCPNLDPWAMRPATHAAVLASLADADPVVAEGVMGLYDGAADGTGSTADLAAETRWPVVLVADVKGQGASLAALARGFASHDPRLRLAGVIANRTGGERHRRLLAEALEGVGIPLLGCLPRDDALALPSRHLGLVQAGEHPDLERFLDAAADRVAEALDLDALARLAAPLTDRPVTPSPDAPGLPPPGQRIAVARDEAFAFLYPHLLDGWRAAGAELAPFSPLADEAPDPAADAIFLPGGYPELRADRLAAATRFLDGLRAAAARGAVVYGECGGYMVLGQGLEDADGRRHAMAGLLPVETSFAEPRLHLGYRRLTLRVATPFGPAGARLAGHEFHYARQTGPAAPDPLFEAEDATGRALGAIGARSGTVFGSYAHLVDRADGARHAKRTKDHDGTSG